MKLPAKQHYGRWSIEYRPEVMKWELMEGTAHRGLFQTPEAALAAIRLCDPEVYF